MNELPLPTLYGPVILWERPVQIAAADFLTPGDTAFDVGGNTGGVAIALSRLVGAAGRVYTFECNPRMVRWIEQDLAANSVSNVELIAKAVYKQARHTLNFYLDESYYAAASSLYREPVGKAITVETTTIDDVVREYGCAPHLIKIDVEGGEADALAGAAQTIDAHRPAFVLEHAPGAADYLEFLWSLDYALWDVNTYDQVDAAYRSQRYSSNVVAVPRERGRYTRSANGSRIVYKAELTYTGDGEGQLLGWSSDSRMLCTMAQASFGHLAHHSCSALVSPADQPIDLQLNQVAGDGVIELKNVETYGVDFVRTT